MRKKSIMTAFIYSNSFMFYLFFRGLEDILSLLLISNILENRDTHVAIFLLVFFILLTFTLYFLFLSK